MNPFWQPITMPPLHLQIPRGQSIITYKIGDVTGDGFSDFIYITADKQTDSSPFLRNITLFVKYGRSNHIEMYRPPENAGYNPTLWLGDLTGDGIQDIFLVIDSGGSGGIIYAYVYSVQNGIMKNIFDSIKFNEQHTYNVQYLNQYKASVMSKKPSKKYTLDLTYKGKEYLNEIYNADGTLKAPIEGWVDPISALNPVDLARNGKYYLLGMQQIAGRFHADGLGIVENLLNWDGSAFSIVRQTVAIYGEDF
nr:VCBS repeat-containing protein [Lysinibacillus timonensis]